MLGIDHAGYCSAEANSPAHPVKDGLQLYWVQKAAVHPAAAQVEYWPAPATHWLCTGRRGRTSAPSVGDQQRPLTPQQLPQIVHEGVSDDILPATGAQPLRGPIGGTLAAAGEPPTRRAPGLSTGTAPQTQPQPAAAAGTATPREAHASN